MTAPVTYQRTAYAAYDVRSPAAETMSSGDGNSWFHPKVIP